MRVSFSHAKEFNDAPPSAGLFIGRKMISKQQYIGPYAKSKDLTPPVLANIDQLLRAVNSLMQVGMDDGVTFQVNQDTKSQVAGQKNGGFREQCCTIGAPASAHKLGMAVDLYDPFNQIDAWLMQSPVAKIEFERLNLYFEHPDATKGWSHWSIKPPGSGRRFFYP